RKFVTRVQVMLNSAAIVRPLRVSEMYRDPSRVDDAGPKEVQLLDRVRDQNANPTSPLNLPKMGSGLVCRLICAQHDTVKERIRMWLIDLDDAQLRSGLGLTVEDIAVLRTGTKTASPLR